MISLDDTVFWGALPMLRDAADLQVRDCSARFINRRLPKCIDIRQQLVTTIAPERPTTANEREAFRKRLARLCVSIEKRLQDWSSDKSTAIPRILTDRAARDPYKRFQESKGPLNQLLIRGADNRIIDMVDCSPVVAAIEPFDLFRAYVDDNDVDAKTVIADIVKQELKGNADGDG